MGVRRQPPSQGVLRQARLQVRRPPQGGFRHRAAGAALRTPLNDRRPEPALSDGRTTPQALGTTTLWKMTSMHDHRPEASPDHPDLRDYVGWHAEYDDRS